MTRTSLLALSVSLALSLAPSHILAMASAQSADTGAPLPAATASPKVYGFPMDGQMGTDLSEPIFKTLIEDVKKQKPDIVVLRLKSADVDRINHLRNDNPN